MKKTQVSGDGKVAVILHVKPGYALPEHLTVQDKIKENVVLLNIFASEIDELRGMCGILSIQVSKTF